MSKRESRALELSRRLSPITERQAEYARRHSDSYAFTYYRKTYCSECGSPVVNGKCSGCGNVYREERVRSTRRDGFYYGIVTTCGGMQVIRHFLVEKFARKGEGPEFTFLECFQNWIDDDGRETVIARQRAPYTYDGWIPDSEMKVRRRYSAYYCPYDIGDYLLCSGPRVTKRLKRNGFGGDFYGMKPLELFHLLLTENLAETLVKTGRGSLLKHGILTLKRYERELAVCHRHRYEITDASMWFDTIGMMRECGTDTLNPKNACPENLQEAHDAAMARLRRKREKEERKRERERLAKELERISESEEAYADAKGRFFGLALHGNGIVVTVLQSVRDVYDEGLAMHHCVFANRYYERRDSLLMSAKDTEGRRLETIEFDLRNGTILQSRGVCNRPSESHDAIMELVSANAPAIMKMKRRKRQAA